MPAPTTINEFVELVQKSGVLDSKKLDAYMEKLRAAMAQPGDPSKLAGLDPGKLAGLMVRDGVLTNFQAEQFLQGKWRRFTIGKYKVLERLGSGGMGSVYLCEHRLMRRRVAVKVLPAAKAEDSSSLERFYREARAVAALDHPNIVRAYDIDQDEKLHFLVMEYVDGASLQEMVKRGGPLDILRACHYMRQAAYGLQHAHETAGLVHRDIKPGNVLVDRTGVVKILDMGLARFFNDEDDILTKKYDENVLGTADYLAPEQALDSHGVDIRADVYSLGGTFYFCLTGRTPFSEGTVAQKLIWHQTRQPKPIKQVRPEVPDGVIAVIDRMMTKDPAGRYQTPAEIAAALEPFTRAPIGPPPEAEMPRLSLAATGSPPSMEGSTKPQTQPPTSGSGSGKAWTVANAPTKAPAAPAPRPPTPPGPPAPPPTATAPQVPATPATRAAPPVAAPRPAAVAPVPAPRPAPVQAKNGQPTAPPPAPAARPSSAAVEASRINESIRPASQPQLVSAPTEADADDDALPWDKLASDTDPAGRRADTSPRSGRKPKPQSGVRAPLDLRRGIPLWLILVAVGGVLVVGLGAIGLLVLLFLPKTPSAGTGNAPLIVSSTRQGAYRTVRDAVAMAKPGQQVQIDEDVITERLTLDNSGDQKLGHGVTITAAPGRTVLWKPPAGVGRAGGEYFIKLGNVPGLQLKHITFDGEGKIDEMMLLIGTNPDLRFEDVTFLGFKQTAVKISNAAGSSDDPILFLRTTIASGAVKAKHALSFSALPTMIPATNQSFTFRDFTIEGDYEDPIKVANQEVRSVLLHNAVWKGPKGVQQIIELPKPPPPKPKGTAKSK